MGEILPGALGLLALIIVAYLPVLRAQFIWDDDAYVTDNPLLGSVGGLVQIWFRFGATIQYYPLVFTSFWIEHHLWGLSPVGYHVVNVLLHGVGAVLLWRVLRRLDVPGAGLAACLFAVHPVHVESVAWVTERKNVLSLVFYLLAAREFIRFAAVDGDTTGQSRRTRSYIAGLALFACSLLSKTSTVGLPLALLLVIYWKRGTVRLKEIVCVAPMLVMSLVAGLVTSYVERRHVGAGELSWTLSAAERFVLAGRSLCFYLGKVFWPADLAFVYHRWSPSPLWPQALFLIVVIAAVIVLWILRRRIGQGPMIAAVFFAMSLAPTLGFVSFYFMTYSWVADHFQYIASIGPIVMAAAVIHLVFARRTKARIAVSAALIGALTFCTINRARVFENQETLWNDVLAKSPSAAQQAHDNLAVYFGGIGRTDDEIRHYQASLVLKPDAPETRSNLAIALYRQGRIDEAIAQLETALRSDANHPSAGTNLGMLLTEKGRLADAEAAYRRVLATHPEVVAARFNLARLLAKSGRVREAVGEYEAVLRVTPDDAESRAELARARAALMKSGG